MKPKSSSNKLNVWSEVKSALDLSALDFDDQVKSQVQVQLDAPLRLFLKPESERVLIKAQKYLKFSHGHHGQQILALSEEHTVNRNTFLKVLNLLTWKATFLSKGEGMTSFMKSSIIS